MFVSTCRLEWQVSVARSHIILNLKILKFFAEKHQDFKLSTQMLAWQPILKSIVSLSKTKPQGDDLVDLATRIQRLRDDIDFVVSEKCSDAFLDEFWANHIREDIHAEMGLTKENKDV